MSPSLPVDKSPDQEAQEEVAPRRASDVKQPSVLAIHRGAGVTKKTRKSRRSQLSSRARKRHERDVDMAEAVVERTAKKVAKSVDQLNNMRSRRKAWDEVNSSVAGVGERSGDKKKKKIAEASSFAVLGDDDWETDEEMDEVEEQQPQENVGSQEETVPVLKRRVVPSQGVVVPEMVIAPTNEDDEIL